MKNIVLAMNAIVLILTLSIVILPKLWMVSVVGGADGLKGISFPIIWTVYAVTVFITAGFTFSWLVKSGR
ncbi:MAG: Unknown protein [uncultured Sulfurovum sp.]|uniref:Uncharacterized protein n=1 Tax=uncultured Sulfurovum sp. TaxID=269237 RepID=A0A6S6SKB2_9BACT|nr:MAG: Unknown protein [uncultured Sulfurovum sp.]